MREAPDLAVAALQRSCTPVCLHGHAMLALAFPAQRSTLHS